MFEWIAGTTAGKFISTFFISMLPVVELRAGLPYGIALGLDYPLALTAAVLLAIVVCALTMADGTETGGFRESAWALLPPAIAIPSILTR